MSPLSSRRRVDARRHPAEHLSLWQQAQRLWYHADQPNSERGSALPAPLGRVRVPDRVGQSPRTGHLRLDSTYLDFETHPSRHCQQHLPSPVPLSTSCVEVWTKHVRLREHCQRLTMPTYCRFSSATTMPPISSSTALTTTPTAPRSGTRFSSCGTPSGPVHAGRSSATCSSTPSWVAFSLTAAATATTTKLGLWV